MPARGLRVNFIAKPGKSLAVTALRIWGAPLNPPVEARGDAMPIKPARKGQPVPDLPKLLKAITKLIESADEHRVGFMLVVVGLWVMRH